MVNIPYLALLVGIRPVRSNRILVFISEDMKYIYTTSKEFEEFVYLQMGKIESDVHKLREVFDFPETFIEGFILFQNETHVATLEYFVQFGYRFCAVVIR
jgi:hypothetical protein